MRFLSPGWLVLLESGLWAVDRYQPVAAVLDPGNGSVRRLVSWADLPPPAAERYSHAVILDDGTSLWIQQESGGPVARVTSDGIAATGQLDQSEDPLMEQTLQVCRLGVAWCSSSASEYEVVRAGAPSPPPPRRGKLQRVDEDGRVHTVSVDRGVRELRDTPTGLLVAVVGDDVHRRPRWDRGRDRVAHGTRWYRLPWEETPPSTLTDRYALPRDFQPPPAESFSPLVTQSVAGYGPIAASTGVEWFAHPSQSPSTGDRSWARPVLSARDAHGEGHGTTVASWALGEGWIDAVAAQGTRLFVALARRPVTWASPVAQHPVEVLVVDAADGSRSELLPAAAVDITDRRWPLETPPPDVESSTRDELRAAQRGAVHLERAGAREVQCRVDGPWPTTVLELTFTTPRLPGVRLRHRVPLFDELGRWIGSQSAAAHLVDRLASRWVPLEVVEAGGFVDV